MYHGEHQTKRVNWNIEFIKLKINHNLVSKLNIFESAILHKELILSVLSRYF